MPWLILTLLLGRNTSGRPPAVRRVIFRRPHKGTRSARGRSLRVAAAGSHPDASAVYTRTADAQSPARRATDEEAGGRAGAGLGSASPELGWMLVGGRADSGRGTRRRWIA